MNSPSPTKSSGIQLPLVLSGSRGAQTVVVPVSDLIIAGWTGRNEEALQAHIRELAEHGIGAPKETPVFYRTGATLLSTAHAVQVIGKDSTGEVEFVIFAFEESLLVGLGSDHTDRKAEVFGITLSKQMCPKPVAAEVWEFAEVEPHWDELILRAYSIVDGEQTLYQEGRVSAMRHPRDLLNLYHERTGTHFASGAAMFCGTFAVEGELRWSDTFAMELEDPVLRRRITHRYNIHSLPVQG